MGVRASTLNGLTPEEKIIKKREFNIRKWRLKGETKKLYLAGAINFKEAWWRAADGINSSDPTPVAPLRS